MNDQPCLVYLKLFHGRKTVDDVLDDWGEQGPILGPFGYVHITYACDLKVCYLDANGVEHEDMGLRYVDDLVYYDGMFYGDISVTTIERLGKKAITLYDPVKAQVPAEYLKKKKEAADEGQAHELPAIREAGTSSPGSEAGGRQPG